MNPLADLMETWVGRGRPVSVEQLAREADAGERTVNRWIEDNGEPHLKHVQNILASTILPLEFRKQLADYVLRGAVDLRAAVCGVAARNDSPLRVTFDIDDELNEIQRDLHEALHPSSTGGESISVCEGSRIDPRLSRVEVKLNELRRAINDRRLKAAV